MRREDHCCVPTLLAKAAAGPAVEQVGAHRDALAEGQPFVQSTRDQRRHVAARCVQQFEKANHRLPKILAGQRVSAARFGCDRAA
jgi:hypothetical protein